MMIKPPFSICCMFTRLFSYTVPSRKDWKDPGTGPRDPEGPGNKKSWKFRSPNVPGLPGSFFSILAWILLFVF